MAIRIYDFDDFDGIAEVDEKGDYELRIYFKGKCNCDAVICTRFIRNGETTYNLYNFILDKEHMRNMEDVNWFRPITKINLFMCKLTALQKDFINYALKNKVEVNITPLPF